MCPPIGRENLIIEILDAQAQTRDADFLERLDLRLVQGARLALKRDLLGIIPAHMPIEALNEMKELLLADVRGRPAAEIGEAELPALQRGHTAVSLHLLDEGAEVDLDLGGILV